MDYGILTLRLEAGVLVRIISFPFIIVLFFFISLKSKIQIYYVIDNFRNEDIPNPVISRFFQVNFESGVTSIQLTMNSIKENYTTPVAINNYIAYNSTVEAKASLIYNYEDGSRVW